MRQFENPANPAIHERTTGPEIWDDTDGARRHPRVGVGTGGTITGVSRYLKQTQGKAITSVAVEPAHSPVITQTRAGKELARGTPQDPGHRRGLRAEEPRPLPRRPGRAGDQRRGHRHGPRLAREEGILCGISCGAAMVAAQRLAHDPTNAGKTIVVVLPDAGERYLTGALFEGMFDESRRMTA
jgi:cysteine synthase A